MPEINLKCKLQLITHNTVNAENVFKMQITTLTHTGNAANAFKMQITTLTHTGNAEHLFKLYITTFK